MTAAQTVHLIEQFAAQAPFAVWITDSRGVSIFANRKLHELFGIPEHPSGALGFNLFDDPSIGALGLNDIARRARAGEVIDTTVDVPRPEEALSRMPGGRKGPLNLHINCYALRSSAQTIEHYTIVIEDVTEAYRQRAELRNRLHDLAIYSRSKDARKARYRELAADIERLEKEIRARGAEPTA